jgi:hypothetical protein
LYFGTSKASKLGIYLSTLASACRTAHHPPVPRAFFPLEYLFLLVLQPLQRRAPKEDDFVEGMLALYRLLARSSTGVSICTFVLVKQVN